MTLSKYKLVHTKLIWSFCYFTTSIWLVEPTKLFIIFTHAISSEDPRKHVPITIKSTMIVHLSKSIARLVLRKLNDHAVRRSTQNNNKNKFLFTSNCTHSFLKIRRSNLITTKIFNTPISILKSIIHKAAH